MHGDGLIISPPSPLATTPLLLGMVYYIVSVPCIMAIKH